MNFMLWIMIGIVVMGFIVIFTMKKGMENKLAVIIASGESTEASAQAKNIIWWIWGTVLWGIASLILIIWMFQYFLGA